MAENLEQFSEDDLQQSIEQADQEIAETQQEILELRQQLATVTQRFQYLQKSKTTAKRSLNDMQIWEDKRI